MVSDEPPDDPTNSSSGHSSDEQGRRGVRTAAGEMPALRLVHSRPEPDDTLDEQAAAEADARYDALLDEIAAEFAGFRVIRKQDSFLQRSIHVALRVLTAGAQSDYLDAYVTTLGERVYVPPDWDERSASARYVTMRHELIHLRQFRRYGFVLMAFAYLLFPLPMGLAWGRMRLERAAYEETVRAACEVYGHAHVCDAAFRSHIVSMFTSGAYAWMWPFPRAVERWYDVLLTELEE